MTIEEIRKNKPDGATYYIDHHGVKYYRLDEYGHIQIYNDGEWHELHLHISETVLKPL